MDVQFFMGSMLLHKECISSYIKNEINTTPINTKTKAKAISKWYRGDNDIKHHTIKCLKLHGVSTLCIWMCHYCSVLLPHKLQNR